MALVSAIYDKEHYNMASALGLASGYDETMFGVKGTGDVLKAIFGTKPQVAGFEDVILGDEQLKAILANLKAFLSGDLQKLGNLYQDYMFNLYGRAGLDLKDLISKGGGTVGQMLGTAKQELAGQVPTDVQNVVRRATAQQNLASGLWGGGMGAANWGRNLGLTSLDLIGKGAQLAGEAGNAAARWAGIASGTMLPSSSFLINPTQQYESTLSNRLIQRQIQQERFNVAAAPNPVAKGLSDLVAYLAASYIGHGAAGQPPKATDYSGLTGAGGGVGSQNADIFNAGGSFNAGNAAGSTTTGPADFGAGAGSGAGGQADYSKDLSFAPGANQTYAYNSNPYADLYGVNAFLTTG
jgi:hypothetical protein